MLPKISAHREEPTPEGALVECSEKLRNFLADFNDVLLGIHKQTTASYTSSP